MEIDNIERIMKLMKQYELIKVSRQTDSFKLEICNLKNKADNIRG